jgi:hypothetical protein
VHQEGVITPPGDPLTLDGFVLRLPAEGDIAALVRFGDDPDTAETLSRAAEKAGFEFRAIRRTTTPGTSEQYDELLYVVEPPTRWARPYWRNVKRQKFLFQAQLQALGAFPAHN